MATNTSTVFTVIKSKSGTEYKVEMLNDHLCLVSWITKDDKLNTRYTRTFKEGKRVAQNYADLSNGLARR